jgi:aminomethyltransferase (EC 2.1.2.10)
MTDRTPPLHGVHEARGATFTDFGGWEMPVEFDSIREEHAAVRDSVASSTSHTWARSRCRGRTRRR